MNDSLIDITNRIFRKREEIKEQFLETWLVVNIPRIFQYSKWTHTTYLKWLLKTHELVEERHDDKISWYIRKRKTR